MNTSCRNALKGTASLVLAAASATITVLSAELTHEISTHRETGDSYGREKAIVILALASVGFACSTIALLGASVVNYTKACVGEERAGLAYNKISNCCHSLFSIRRPEEPAAIAVPSNLNYNFL